MKADQGEFVRSSPSTGSSLTAPKRAARLVVSAARLSAIGFAVALGFAHLACGKSHKLGPGSTSPNPVTNFQAEVQGSDAVRLTWTSPSGDSPAGRASGYDIRQSAGAITDSTFSSADTIGTPPAPGNAGALQQCYATEIPGSATRYFAIRASNLAGDWSPLVAVGPVQTTEDIIPPSRVTDLSIVSTSDTTVTLSWTAPGDDGIRGKAYRYEIRYLGGLLGSGEWEFAHPVAAGAIEPQSVGLAQSDVIWSVTPRVLVSIALRAVDESGNQSPVSNTVSVTLRGVIRRWDITPLGTGDAANIQAGIDSSMAGDTVLVEPGTYAENIVFRGRDIVLKSAEGPDVTTLDGSQERQPVITVSNGETDRTIVEGFTITGGSGFQEAPASEAKGGGVYGHDTNPTVRGNVFRLNLTTGTGAAINLLADGNKSILIEDNMFFDNVSMHNGGAVACGGLIATIRHNVFHRNQCRYDGGALYLGFGYGQLLVSDNTFLENSAGDHGGAIHAIGGGGGFTFERNVIAKNVAGGEGVGDSGSGGGLYCEQLFASQIRNNTFVSNIGYGESPHSGGAIALFSPTRTSPQIENNIFVSNLGGAVACRFEGGGSLGANLYWKNDLDVDSVACPQIWQPYGIFADPQFCDEAANDFRVSERSPARTGEDVMGAFSEPDCQSTATANAAPWFGVWLSRQ